MKKTITTLWQTDARLTAVGFAMLALLAATGVALLVDPREVLGAPAWMKPAKFAASIAIYTLTLAWVFTYLPEWRRTRGVVSWVTAVTLLLEIVIIDVQAWRGTTSHFNVGTVMDGVLFTIMGLAILIQTLTAITVAVAVVEAALLRPRARMGPALRHDHYDHRRHDRGADDAADARAAGQRAGRPSHDSGGRTHGGRG